MNEIKLNQEIEDRLGTLGEIDHIKLTGDGYHFDLLLVSDIFEGKSKILRQQLVYSKLNDYITSGQLHALSMKTLTRKEWEQQNG